MEEQGNELSFHSEKITKRSDGNISPEDGNRVSSEPAPTIAHRPNFITEDNRLKMEIETKIENQKEKETKPQMKKLTRSKSIASQNTRRPSVFGLAQALLKYARDEKRRSSVAVPEKRE